jgi:hypothetical protein
MHDLSNYTAGHLLARMDQIAVGPGTYGESVYIRYLCECDPDCEFNSVFAISDELDRRNLTFEAQLDKRLNIMVRDSLNRQYLIALKGERQQAERHVKYLYRKVAAA